MNGDSLLMDGLHRNNLKVSYWGVKAANGARCEKMFVEVGSI